jgi:hypothetical protein
VANFPLSLAFVAFPVPLGKGGRQGNKQRILATQHNNKGRSRPHRDGVKNYENESESESDDDDAYDTE